MFYHITTFEDPEEEWRCSFTLFLTLALDEDACSTPRPGFFPPGKGTRYSYRRLGWSQVQSGQVWKSLLGFKLQTFQPIASCCTDYTAPVTLHLCRFIILIDSWCLQFPLLLIYDTYRTHSPDHPHVEGSDTC